MRGLSCHLCFRRIVPSSVVSLSSSSSPSRSCVSTRPAISPVRSMLPSPLTTIRTILAPASGTTSAPTSAPNAADDQSVKHAAAAASRAATAGLLSPTTLRRAAEPDSKSSLPDLDRITSLVDQTNRRFLSTPGIPAEEAILATLHTCLRAATALKPHVARLPGSNFLRLGPGDARKRKAVAADSAAGSALVRLRAAVKQVADAAYTIIYHPPVIITPQVLELVIDIHASLGTATHLVPALELYGSKPLPRPSGSGTVYRLQNPRRAAAAIEAPAAARALHVAVAVRDLDSAIGVAEACYNTDAFSRQKLLRQAGKPVLALLTAPPAIYLLSRRVAQLLDTVEPETFSAVMTMGIGAYVTLTGVLGAMTHLSNTTHKRRVTWQEGTSFWHQWSREEFRAAVDDIACAWGFKDTARHGEEVGVEWDGLREYVLMKQMILDKVELMEGMS